MPAFRNVRSSADMQKRVNGAGSDDIALVRRAGMTVPVKEPATCIADPMRGRGLSHLVSTGIWNNASQWEERLLLRKARPLEDVELECGSCFVHCSYNTASIDCRDLRHVDRIKRVDRNELGTNE